MSEIQILFDKANIILYHYTKTNMFEWLGVNENLILFDNFINLTKENMIKTYGNVQQFTDESSLQKSIEYFKNYFTKPNNNLTTKRMDK